MDEPRRGRGGPGRQLHVELFAAEVQERLQALRRIAVIERDDEARARLAREGRGPPESFARAVARRLRELRALCALASHLRKVAPASGGGSAGGGSADRPAGRR